MTAAILESSLSLADFADHAESFDRCVQQTDGIDRFCSSSAWVHSAYEAFTPLAEPYIFQTEWGYLAMMGQFAGGWGRIWTPLEASWLLASPVVGPEPEALISWFAGMMHRHGAEWDALYFAGFETHSAPWQALVRAFAPRHRILRVSNTCRLIADLSGGRDGFLGRRSAKFRENLRRCVRAADAAGFIYEHSPDKSVEAALADFDVMMEIEAKSWKGLEDQGVNQGLMREFYQKMIRRLASRRMLRYGLLKRDDRPVGYILGAVFDGRFRGFQFSQEDQYRSYGLGNLLQWRMIENLVDEGITAYDLGTDMLYKQRWAERRQVTDGLIVTS